MHHHKARLQDKVAIVTGAGARGDVMGNGKAVSILFAREGAKVLLVDNVEERATKTLEAIQKEGGSGERLRRRRYPGGAVPRHGTGHPG